MAWPADVRKSDLRIVYCRGSGHGGQRRNKRDTACRIWHVPTGIQATAEEHNSQYQNRIAAFRRLAKRLVPLMEQAARGGAGESVPCSGTTRRVRTYHEPRGEVRDHRVPGLRWSYRDLLDGDGLDEVIAAVRRADTSAEGDTSLSK